VQPHDAVEVLLERELPWRAIDGVDLRRCTDSMGVSTIIWMNCSSLRDRCSPAPASWASRRQWRRGAAATAAAR
jgi:hypothetical protein